MGMLLGKVACVTYPIEEYLVYKQNRARNEGSVDRPVDDKKQG